jgi:poly-beta-1,6-N-acetyl-D-glucosamine N-deacetylase
MNRRGWMFPSLLLPLAITLSVPAYGKSLSNLSTPATSEVSSPTPALASKIETIASWIAQPSLGLDVAIGSIAGNVRAYFSPSVWPNIKDRALAARAAVIAYGDIVVEKRGILGTASSEFESQLQQIKAGGLTPISVDRLASHLRTGLPLPEKPIVLTFDGGYVGHYNIVFPLLKRYGYPAQFAIDPLQLHNPTAHPRMTWAQLKEMADDPLVTIAAQGITHPKNVTRLPDEMLEAAFRDSKQILEAHLGLLIQSFVYSEDNPNRQWTVAIAAAGYSTAFTMAKGNGGFAEQSETMLAIERFAPSSLPKVVSQAWGGPALPKWRMGFDFAAPVSKIRTVVDKTPFTMIAGGRPITIHAKSRYQVPEIVARTKAIAGVDGGFFSLKFLDSNVMIGPVISQSTCKFIPGNAGENKKLTGRPLVLIGPFGAKFVPFDPVKHNTLAGIKAVLPEVTDGFVAAAFLVKNGEPQPPEAFGSLFNFNVPRDRAFWGINQAGQPQIGVSNEPIGSVNLGKALSKAGFRHAVMLDSGASTSLVYQSKSLVDFSPRPVPHVVALVPPSTPRATSCMMAAK